MANYNFDNLSPVEFEELSRDLLQEHLKLTLESFASHHDSGIDFRYAKGRLLIVQCKRYARFDYLFANLKEEVKKVALLKPKTYILTTSASLSVPQKKKIIKLFGKYIKSSDHIFGRQDLNNLLNLYPKVESGHFKLWLSSVNILQKTLHGKIFAQSDFEMGDIKKASQVFVENASFSKVLDILKKKRFVLITGIPGVGKTTLSRIVVLYFLSKGYEFYFLSKSIDEGKPVYKAGVKQIFFFDDFLGRSFLEDKLGRNEDAAIIKFIE
ncbi:MAG TPA: restriction endonuclease, partial [Puia sp.]